MIGEKMKKNKMGKKMKEYSLSITTTCNTQILLNNI